MEKEFIPYEQALALKQLGFDEPCFGIYQKNKKVNIGKVGMPAKFPKNSTCWNCSAPTFSQCFRWFREKYGLCSHIFSKEDNTFVWCVRWYVDGLQKDIPYESSKTYEEAELECLKKIIEIVKEK